MIILQREVLSKQAIYVSRHFNALFQLTFIPDDKFN
jgi:hypothetical protein